MWRVLVVEDDVEMREIYTREAIKSEVRDIAKQEGLSAGVAAEALLRLGIETYLFTCETSVKCEPPERKLGPMTELFVMARQQSTLPSTHPSIIGSPIKANQSNQDLTKPLVTYSSRTTQNIPEPTLIPKPLAKAPDVERKTMAEDWAYYSNLSAGVGALDFLKKNGAKD